MQAVLTIAGSDSSGGAGIQADIKTICAHGLFAESAVTALTAQNTTGVFGVEDASPAFVERQIDVVFDDIRPDAVKIGMVSTPDAAHAIASALRRNAARNVVVDPVMVATSGSALIATEAVAALVSELFPMAAVVTPNIPEACALAEMEIACEADMERAAEIIAERTAAAAGIALSHGGNQGTPPSQGGGLRSASGDDGGGRATCAVLVKGGHGVGDPARADDLLRLADGETVWLRGPRIDNPNTHGTGCTLSSAIACGLASGLDVREAVCSAKEYVAGALAAQLDLGRGSGPLDHMWEYRKI